MSIIVENKIPEAFGNWFAVKNICGNEALADLKNIYLSWFTVLKN